MTDEQRVPKVGEVWTLGDSTRTVWAVYDGQVAVQTEDDVRMIVGLDYFLGNYDPPEPTVVASQWLTPSDGGGVYVKPYLTADATHRLDRTSDGEFRVVKL